jgi:SSS family solute:Na+ symporter
MNELLFFGIFIALCTFYLVLGLISSRKVHTTSDYFLAGRNLSLTQVTFTLVATQVGGGMLVGTSQDAYCIGFCGMAYTIGMSIGFLCLGLGLASRLRSLNVATTAELFETKYHSIGLKKCASLLSVVSMCGILIAQIVGSRTLLLGLNIQNEFLFLAFWCFVIIYTVIGGLSAVVTTDLAQVMYIIITFGAIFAYSVWQNPASLLDLARSQGAFAAGPMDLHYLSAAVLMPTLFSFIEQDLAQRFFAARNARIAALSALCAGGILIAIALIPIYFGMNAKLMNIPVPEGSSPLIAAIAHFTSPLVLVLAACGVMAAITSTADSLLCAISSNLAQDFNFHMFKNINKVKLAQAITLIIGCFTLSASYMVPQQIIQLMISSYEISVCCLLVPLMFAYFNDTVRKEAAVLSIAGGLAGFFIFRFYPVVIPKEIASLLLSLAGYGVGHMIGLPSNKKSIE